MMLTRSSERWRGKVDNVTAMSLMFVGMWVYSGVGCRSLCLLVRAFIAESWCATHGIQDPVPICHHVSLGGGDLGEGALCCYLIYDMAG